MLSKVSVYHVSFLFKILLLITLLSTLGIVIIINWLLIRYLLTVIAKLI